MSERDTNKVKTYMVRRKQVHHTLISVEATSPEEARIFVRDGGGEETDFFEFSHMLPMEDWDVEDEHGDVIL